MAFLGRAYEKQARRLTPEQQEIEVDINNKAQVIHDTIKGVELRRSPQGPWWHLFRAVYCRSAVVQYPVVGEPEHVRMHAWLEDLWGEEANFMTQPVSLLSGKPIALEKPKSRAYTYHGRLDFWMAGLNTDDYDRHYQRLSDITDTLGLVVEATQTTLGIDRWRKSPHLAAAMSCVEGNELDEVRKYYLETGLVKVEQLSLDHETKQSVMPFNI